jgi:hypothetical protein
LPITTTFTSFTVPSDCLRRWNLSNISDPSENLNQLKQVETKSSKTSPESCCASTPALMGLFPTYHHPPLKQKTWSHEATNYFPKSDIQPGNKSHRGVCPKVCHLCYRPTTWTFALPVVPSASTLVASAGAISQNDLGAIPLLRSQEK